ncbi:MAG: hypothetical protein ABI983_02495 [Acidobacteriota bacterium]
MMSASNQKTQSARQGKSKNAGEKQSTRQGQGGQSGDVRHDRAQHAGPRKQPGQGGTGHGAMSAGHGKGQGDKNVEGGNEGGGKNN